jgi:hypothetical protein
MRWIDRKRCTLSAEGRTPTEHGVGFRTDRWVIELLQVEPPWAADFDSLTRRPADGLVRLNEVSYRQI